MDHKDQNIQFSLSGLHLVSFSLEPPPSQTIRPDETVFDFSLEQKADFNTKVFVVGVDIKIGLREPQIKMASFLTFVHFIVSDFDNVLKVENGQLIVPESLAVLTAGVSISTVRGIIYSHLKGTYLNNVLMPIINPQTLFSQKQTADQYIETTK